MKGKGKLLVATTVLLTMLTVSGLYGCAPQTGPAPGAIRVMMPTDSLAFLPVYAAMHNGFFASEGLTIDPIVAGGEGPDIKAVVAKEAPFAVTAGTAIIKINLEVAPQDRVIGVQQTMGRNTQSLVMDKRLADSLKITDKTPLDAKLQALKGKTIGATAAGSLTFLLATYLSKRAGLEPGKDVKIIGVGAAAPLFAAMETKNIDAATLWSPFTEEAILKNKAVMLVDNMRGDIPELKQWAHEVLLARADFVKQNPELVKKMARALTKGNKWVKESTPEQVYEAVKLRSAFIGLDKTITTAAIKAVQEGVVADGLFTEASIMSIVKFMQATGTMKAEQSFNWQDLVTNEYLK